MRNEARKFVIWTRDFESDWEPTGEPMEERAASREVMELRNVGVQAKALPLGTKPETSK